MLRNSIKKHFLIRSNTFYYKETRYIHNCMIQFIDERSNLLNTYTLGIDIGSTTVKIAILDEQENLLFADYERHFANIQETLADLLEKAQGKLGEMTLCPVITGSGGLTLANHLEIPVCAGSHRSFNFSCRSLHQRRWLRSTCGR